MKIKIENLPNYRIAYVRQVGPYSPYNSQTMENLKNWAKDNNLLHEKAIILGIAQDHPDTTPPEKCRYDACLVISNDYEIDEAVSEGELSGGKYAIYKVKHTVEDIQQAWDGIFTELRNNDYQIDDKPIFERYSGELINQDYCEICVPVK
ncbi:AraC family transcriptional regulator [Priestia endophytica]